MSNLKLCAFADETSAEIDHQIEALKRNSIPYLEIRNVDSVNIAKITLEKAKEVTKKGGICLLSPASASYGFFKNFEERGKEYKKLVLGLS